MTFFIQAIFKYLNIGSDSVNHDESGDIKFFVQFPGNSILKISLGFWNCVGCVHMRGRFIFKITHCVDFIAPVILICKIRGTYLISHQPTKFQPTKFQIFGRFFMQNHICPTFLRIFWYIWKVCRIMSTYPNVYAKVKKLISDVQFPGNCSSLKSLKMFFKLYNQSYSDLSFIRLVQKS